LRVFKNILDFNIKKPVATIGIFDGVHLAHLELIKRVRQLAEQYNSESLVITLWPHPRLVLKEKYSELRLLTTLDEKIEIIERYGVENLLILPFTLEFANIPFDSFINEYLIERVSARHLVVGFNHHFGKDRKGSFESLRNIASEHGVVAEKLEPVFVNDCMVSSSCIRNMLTEGRIKAANDAMGYRYFIKGEVVHGDHIGRKLGYPTANIMPGEKHKLIPLNGVYAVEAMVRGKTYKGMLNIGVRPTITEQNHNRTIEVHIFNFNENIYGEQVKLTFYEWMRYEKKFRSVEDLTEQLKLDERGVLSYFEQLGDAFRQEKNR